MGYSTFWLVLILAIVVCFGLAAILPKADPTLNKPESKPVTDRQLDFMDALIAEREVPSGDWVLAEDPQTAEEASKMIEHLLTLPHRRSD